MRTLYTPLAFFPSQHQPKYISLLWPSIRLCSLSRSNSFGSNVFYMMFICFFCLAQSQTQPTPRALRRLLLVATVGNRSDTFQLIGAFYLERLLGTYPLPFTSLVLAACSLIHLFIIYIMSSIGVISLLY